MYHLRKRDSGVVGIVFLILVATFSPGYANAQRIAHGTAHVTKKTGSAATQTYSETVVHQFAHFGGDGAQPSYGLVSDSLGNYYGVTDEGGGGQGSLFELAPNGDGSMSYNLLGGFGEGPNFITVDNQNNLYVIADNAYGNVFELSKETSGNWIISNAYGFTGQLDGRNPTMVLPDGAGNVYGSTAEFFELQAADDQWLFDPLFPAYADAILMEKSGDFYGTSLYNGIGDNGVVLKLHSGKDGWGETIIHYFQGGANDGSFPIGGMTFGPDGAIYGVTAWGHQQSGSNCCGGVYKITKSGGITWLYAFTGGADGGYPTTAVVFDQQGNLYGVTSAGGNLTGPYCGSGCGVVYKLTPPPENQGGYWAESVLYSFSGGTDGYLPVGPLLLNSDGDVYGVTVGGGDGYGIGGDGVIFELTPNAVATSVNITNAKWNPSLVGRVVTVSFAVAQTVAGINSPTGTVTVTANTGESCFQSLPAKGKGSCQLEFATAGTRTLTASYSGDAGNLSSVSSSYTENVIELTTTAITRNAPDPAKIGQPVTVDFTVASKTATNRTRPTGSVTVNASTGESCTATVPGSGKGSCKLTFSFAGARTLNATYGGNADNAGSLSNAVDETVN